MKEIIIQNVKSIPDPLERLNHLRHHLQAEILRCLHEKGAFQCLSFVGGTALHFLYALPRFSEDLDFSLESPEYGYHPNLWMKKLYSELTLSGYNVETSWHQDRLVEVGWVRFPSIPMESGITTNRRQKLSIKIEVDTNPPSGAQTERRLLSQPFLFAVRHYDLPSLMAGKIHALLTRTFVRGRDWFDLMWYLTQRELVHPNLALLQSALTQTGHQNLLPAEKWLTHVSNRFTTLNWNTVKQDVDPLLSNPRDRNLFTRENMKQMLEGTVQKFKS